MVIVLLVMPVPFLKPAQLPALMPATALPPPLPVPPEVDPRREVPPVPLPRGSSIRPRWSNLRRSQNRRRSNLHRSRWNHFRSRPAIHPRCRCRPHRRRRPCRLHRPPRCRCCCRCRRRPARSRTPSAAPRIRTPRARDTPQWHRAGLSDDDSESSRSTPWSRESQYVCVGEGKAWLAPGEVGAPEHGEASGGTGHEGDLGGRGQTVVCYRSPTRTTCMHPPRPNASCLSLATSQDARGHEIFCGSGSTTTRRRR